MHIWRDIGPELCLAMYLIGWVIMLLLTYMLTR